MYNSSFKQFFGDYLGKGYMLNFYEKDERLYVDAFWPNLKLLPVSKNEYEIEGYPISFKFYNFLFDEEN